MRISVRKDDFPYFKYGDGNVEIQVQYIAESTIKRITAKHTRRKDNEVDYIECNKELSRIAIVGWRNMDRRAMVELIEPSKKVELDPGETWDDEILFAQDMLNFIVENMHYDFAIFITGAARNIAVYQQAEQAREKENLLNGSSGGRSTPTVKPTKN